MTQNPFLNVFEVEQALGRELTDVEETRVALDIEAIFGIIQNFLNRQLTPTTIVDEKHDIPGAWDRVYPFVEPWHDILYVRFPDANGNMGPSVTYSDWSYPVRDIYFPEWTRIWITYTAGDNLDAVWIPTLKSIMLSAILNGVLSGPQIKYNVISNYSVEGTSISYNSPTQNPENIGPIAVADLNSIDRLRIRVVR